MQYVKFYIGYNVTSFHEGDVLGNKAQKDQNLILGSWLPYPIQWAISLVHHIGFPNEFCVQEETTTHHS